MARYRSISLALATGIASTVVVACAVGQTDDLTVDLGSTEPDVDAGYEARPAESTSAKLPPESTSPAPKEQAPSGKDAGSSAPTPSAPTPTPSAPKPTQGEVLISEVMFDPSTTEPLGEWLEVHNAAASARSLSGLTLYDGAGRAHVIGAGVTIAAGAYKVLVRSQAGATAAKVPASAILYEYGAGLDDASGVLLTNGATGALRLRDGATEIAQAAYGGWFSSPTGKSIQLATLSYAASQGKAGWCLSTTSWATGSDRGTPGAAEDCP